jgi:hypothetical protein
MAQSLKHSQWEVGLDFCLSILINLGIQALFIRSFTMTRGVSFSTVFLVLALMRRYGVRRSFNRIVKSGAGQSRKMSLVEATTDTVLAVVMAFGMVRLWYPNEALPRVSGLILASYLLTLARRFAMRRLFEWLPRRQRKPRDGTPAPTP